MDSLPKNKNGFAPAGTGTKPEMSNLAGDDQASVTEFLDFSKLSNGALLSMKKGGCDDPPGKHTNPAYIHSLLDDAGLTPSEFRVMGHVCRRAGDFRNGRGCYASVRFIADVCHLSEETVRKALRSLVKSHWLRKIERKGKSTEYFPQFPPDSKGTGKSPSTSPPVKTPTYPSHSRGDEGKHRRETKKGSSIPSEGDGTSPPPSEETHDPTYKLTRNLIEALHDNARKNPDDIMGILPLEEVLDLAEEVYQGSPPSNVDPIQWFNAEIRDLIVKRFRPRRKKLGDSLLPIIEEPPF